MNSSRRSMLATAGAVAGLALAVPAAASAATLGQNPIFDLDDDAHTLSERVSDWVVDCQLDFDEQPNRVNLTRAAYKHAIRNSLIDFIPDESGSHNIPTFFGLRVHVPGTKLA